MKKICTLLAGAAIMASQMAYAAIPFNQAFPMSFANGLPTGWQTDAATSVVDGGTKVICPQTAPDYRADLKYNWNNDDNLNIDINASEYKVFAIQFVGQRPQSGVLKLSNIDIDGTGWIKGAAGFSLSEQGHTEIKDINGNSTYYWTIGGEKWTGNLVIKKIEVVIADIKNSADNSYIVRNINWFKNVDELENSLELTKETAVVNETTGRGFADLASAWGRASDGDVLTINENQTISSLLEAKDRNITLKGANADIKITRTNSSNMMFLTNGGGITLENLTLDGNNSESSANFTEATGGHTMTFKNVKVMNAKSSNVLGLVVAKGGGKLALEGLSFENCTVNDKAGQAFVGAHGSTISGNNNLTLAIEVNGNNYSLTAAGELTNTQPIILLPFGETDFPENYVLVKDTQDTNKFQLFNGSTMTIKADADNNLITTTPISTGVNDIIVDNADAPVEYYNLQGVKVANPENGIFIRVQGKDVKKVVIK